MIIHALYEAVEETVLQVQHAVKWIKNGVFGVECVCVRWYCEFHLFDELVEETLDICFSCNGDGIPF
jgi:hypothetical protein